MSSYANVWTHTTIMRLGNPCLIEIQLAYKHTVANIGNYIANRVTSVNKV